MDPGSLEYLTLSPRVVIGPGARFVEFFYWGIPRRRRTEREVAGRNSVTPAEGSISLPPTAYAYLRRGCFFVENVRPAVEVIGKNVIPTQTGDVYGGFAVQTVVDARNDAPSEFAQLSYVAPRCEFRGSTAVR